MSGYLSRNLIQRSCWQTGWPVRGRELELPKETVGGRRAWQALIMSACLSALSKQQTYKDFAALALPI